MIDALLGDVRLAIRQAVSRPAFSGAVVGTIALAMAAAVTGFAAVDAWLLRPLPFPEADRLVVAFGATPERPREPAVWLLSRSAEAWRARSRALETTATAIFYGVTLTTGDEARTAVGLRVTPEFFDVLRVPALLGRTLAAAESPEVVLSHGLWMRHFGGAPSVVGATVRLADVVHTVVGVMPPAFDVRLLDRPEGVEFWTLLPRDLPAYASDGTGPVALFGRLARGADVTTAEVEGNALVREHEARYAVNFDRYVVSVARLQDDNARTVRATLLTLWAAVLMLLLIAAANVGALLAGRGLARQREMAIRMALGAGTARLSRQIAVESGVLIGAGGGLGLALAIVATRVFSAWNPLGSLPPGGIGVDGRVALAALGLTAGAAVIAGVLPARRAAGIDPAVAFRDADDHGHTGRRGWGEAGLLAGQLALALVLVAATGLLSRTVIDLRRSPLGFDGRGVSVAQVHLPQAEFPAPPSRRAFVAALAERLATEPGVTAVGIGSAPLLTGGPVATVRRASDPIDDAPRFGAQDVTDGYFAALGIAVIAGRSFDSRDHAAGQPVVVLNERAATLLFGDARAAVGQAVAIDSEPPRVVIGVAGNVSSTFFNTLEWLTPAIAYRPAAQALEGNGGPVDADLRVHVHVRHRTPLSMVRMRELARGAGAHALVTDLRTAETMIAEATRQPGLRAHVLSCCQPSGCSSSASACSAWSRNRRRVTAAQWPSVWHSAPCRGTSSPRWRAQPPSPWRSVSAPASARRWPRDARCRRWCSA